MMIYVDLYGIIRILTVWTYILGVWSSILDVRTYILYVWTCILGVRAGGGQADGRKDRQTDVRTMHLIYGIL